MHSFCRGIAGLVLLATAGCAGANYAMNDFNGIDPVAWQSPMSGSTFLIFDKPQEARLLIARNSGETNLQDGIANPAPIATDTSPDNRVAQDDRTYMHDKINLLDRRVPVRDQILMRRPLPGGASKTSTLVIQLLQIRWHGSY